jgi:hypothetical protein
MWLKMESDTMLFIVTTVVREPSEVLCAVNSGGHVEANVC